MPFPAYDVDPNAERSSSRQQSHCPCWSCCTGHETVLTEPDEGKEGKNDGDLDNDEDGAAGGGVGGDGGGDGLTRSHGKTSTTCTSILKDNVQSNEAVRNVFVL